MKNEYMRPAVEVSLPVPAGTKSGEPVRVGSINGVAATDEGKGGNIAGYASVVTDARSYLLPVTGTAPTGAGVPVYLTVRSGATAPSLSTTAAGDPWGYVLPAADGTLAQGANYIVRPAQV